MGNGEEGFWLVCYWAAPPPHRKVGCPLEEKPEQGFSEVVICENKESVGVE